MFSLLPFIMTDNKINILVHKYLELIKELYTESKKEVIFGSFLSRVNKPGIAFSTGKAGKDIRAKAGKKQKVQEKKKSRDMRRDDNHKKYSNNAILI